MVSDALWLWPTRFSATTYALRVTINGVTETLTFPSTGSLDLTLDYWPSGDGQTGTETDGTGRADLLAMLQATLRTHSQGAGLTAALTSYRVTITHGTSVTILWTHASTTLDAYAPSWGWAGTADSSAGTTVTATYSPSGLLRWGRPPTVDSRDRQPVTLGIARSLSGVRRASALASPLPEREIVWRFLIQDLALREYASPSWACAEQAWLGALALGRVIRHYADEAAVTSGPGAYAGYSARELAEPIERSKAYQVRWDASFALAREFST